MGEGTLHNTGDVINGRYKISESIGRGATGEVFVATDLQRPGQQIAIKYLKWQPGKPLALEQFKKEFATLTHLSHPNIARVYDFEQDTDNKQFFFTSELIKGQEFMNAVQGLENEQIEDLFVQALRALEYLHGNGIFHFDIKSANLLIGGEDTQRTIKLIDFGLAAIRFQGHLAGTPSYMAPEMIMRENPDGRADLYSLGVLVYAALTGVNPFRTPNMDDTLKKQLHFIPPMPSEQSNAVPKYIDSIIMHLIEKRPADRYQTAAQVIRDINLKSPRKYAVETEETQISYIPWESKFIGRPKELARLENLFKSRQSAIITIGGKNGCGRSRLLSEIKHLAQVSEWATYILTEPSKIGTWQQDVLDRQTRAMFVGVDDYHIAINELWGRDIEEICSIIAKRVTANKSIGTREESIILALAVDDGFKLPGWLDPHEIVDIHLANFSADEIKQYLTTVTGLSDPPRQMVEQVHSNTAGNPFVVTELVKSMVGSGLFIDSQGRWKKTTFEDIKIDIDRLSIPETLEERLLTDFKILPEDNKPFAEMMAVLGRPVTADEAALISGHPVSRGMLMMLVRRGFAKFNAEDGTYFFSRPLTAKAVYGGLSQKDRFLWHKKIAGHLATKTPPEDEELLYHMGRSGNDVESKNALSRLIEMQTKSHHNHDAITNSIYYLKKWKEMEKVIGLARLYNRIGRHDLALSNAKKVLQAAADTQIEIAAYETIGTAFLRKRKFGEAHANFTAALQLAGELPFHQQLRIQNFLAEVAFFEGKLDHAIGIYERTAAAAVKLPRKEQILIKNNNLGQSLFQKGDYKRALEQLEKDLALFTGCGEQRLIMQTQYLLAESFRMERKFNEALNHFNAIIEHAKAVNDLEHLFRAYNGLGNLYFDNNKLDEAASFYERALDISSRLGLDEQSTTCIANLGFIKSSQGDLKMARQYLTSALAFIEGGKSGGGLVEQTHCRIHLELADVLRMSGQFAEAKKHMDEAVKLANRPASKGLLFWIKLTMTRLAKDENDPVSLKRLINEARSLADTKEKVKMLDEFLENPPQCDRHQTK